MASTETFDAVVIGSGIGGLTAARLLAEFGGKKVLILEQHYVLGGLMHEFTRAGKFSFGTGVHYLSGEPGPALNFLTDGRVQFQRLPEDYDVLHFPGFDFAVPAAEEAFIARLAALFPSETRNITAFFKATEKAAQGTLARHIASGMPRTVRAMALPIIEFLYPDTFRTIEKVVARYFSDERLKAVVSARWGLYGPPPSVSAFGGHAMVGLRGFMGGASYPVGGPKELSGAIIAGLERFGVVARASQRVTHIRVENGRAVGVSVEDCRTGERYEVDVPVVISAAGARNTASLVAGAVASPMVAELLKLPDEISTLLLFVGLSASPARLGLQGENHWFMPDLDERNAVERALGDGTLFVSFGSLNNPAARHHTAEIMHFVDPSAFRVWFDTEEGTRPPEYGELKAAIVSRLLDRLDAQWPGFRALVAFAELATPLSFVTYQNSVRGAFYGLANSPERLRSAAAACRTNVKGLLLAGQDAAGPGIEAALWGGVVAANAVLRAGQARQMWRAISSRHAPDPNAGWSGYMRIARVQTISPSVRRIRFAPLNDKGLPFAVRGGQYLTLDLPIGGETVRRSYSIVSAPSEREFIEVAVKRESGGLGSPFLHDEIAVGNLLRLSAPLGDFTVDFARDLGAGHLLLIAGGIGIAPMIALLSEAADVNYLGPITLLASFRTTEDVLFQNELRALEQRLPCLDVVVHITGESDRGQYRAGRIDIEALRESARDARRIHVCGPTPMMREVIGNLLELGIERAKIHTEAFVADNDHRTLVERSAAVRAMAAEIGVTGYPVGVSRGPTFESHPGENLLAAADRAGILIAHSCREGICGKCRVRILSGATDAPASSLFSDGEIAVGWVLACRALALGPLAIRIPDTDMAPLRPEGRAGRTKISTLRQHLQSATHQGE